VKPNTIAGIIVALQLVAGAGALTAGWFNRGDVARPLFLGLDWIENIQFQNEHGWDPVPPLALLDGTVVYWHQDTYTNPNVRCFSSLMSWMKCSMNTPGKLPCEYRLEALCNDLYPP